MNELQNFILDENFGKEYHSALQDDLSLILKEVVLRLSLGQGSDPILDFLFASLHNLIPYDRMSIALVEDEGTTIRLRWVQSLVESKNIPRNYAVPLEGGLREIFRTGKTRVIRDLTQYFDLHPESVSTALILKDGMRSSLTCPLLANNAQIGLVFFSSTKKGVYDESSAPLFSEIARLIALVVEQARLRVFFEKNLFRVQTLRTILHDLRNPLCLIQGMLEVSADERWFVGLPADAKDSFKVIVRNAQFMQELLGDLNSLADDSDLSVDLQPQDVDLLKVCQEWAFTGQVLARRKEIFFESDFDHSLLGRARMDENRIRRVVENILSNAVKFSFPKSTIRFEARVVDGALYVSVTDQGKGIPPGEIPKLFHEFGRTSVRPTAGESSTGLGLAIAKRIIDQHKGHIGVESQPGRGSKFWFSIPIA